MDGWPLTCRLEEEKPGFFVVVPFQEEGGKDPGTPALGTEPHSEDLLHKAQLCPLGRGRRLGPAVLRVLFQLTLCPISVGRVWGSALSSLASVPHLNPPATLWNSVIPTLPTRKLRLREIQRLINKWPEAPEGLSELTVGPVTFLPLP